MAKQQQRARTVMSHGRRPLYLSARTAMSPTTSAQKAHNRDFSRLTTLSVSSLWLKVPLHIAKALENTGQLKSLLT